MSTDDRVRELALQWEEARDQGRPVTPEELCRDCPELLEALKQHIQLLEKFAPVHESREHPDQPTPLPLTTLEIKPGSAAARLSASEAAPRYRIYKFHAKGGMGEVWHAEDQELHRRVALKCIQEHLRDSTDILHRFQMEAEITSKLEHPGVVPVFGMIHDQNGQPYYAMRFVEGESLMKAVKRYHAPPEDAKPDPGERSLAFRDLLNRFVAVCNTIAYAHSRGVIHRDLKPGNVMLGSYGETLLIDWGLAKPSDRTDAEHATNGQPLDVIEGQGRNLTLPGQQPGTPAYMSPEQAEGRGDLVGKAADIYSLGATFYALLTGQAPFTGGDLREVIGRVKRGNFPPPRQVKPEVPRPLEAICLKAMARKPEDRYETVRALAADVEHWLADEPVSAYREPVLTRMRRWARKHKPLMAGLTALLLTALVLGSSVGLWMKWQRDVVKQAVLEDLQRARFLQEQERWAEALQVLERAEGRLAGNGLVALREQVQNLRDEMEMVAKLEEARMQYSTLTDQGLDFRGADQAYAAAFADYGLPLAELNTRDVVKRITQLAIHRQLVAGLDDWADVKQRLGSQNTEQLLVGIRLMDNDEWRQQLRDPVVREDGAKLAQLAGQPHALAQPPIYLAQLGRMLRLRKEYATAERLLRLAHEQNPGDFWINVELAELIKTDVSPNVEEAIGFYRAAVAARPRSSMALNNLGILLKEQTRLAEAETAYRKAIAISPKNVKSYINLGNLLSMLQRPEDAEAAYRTAIEIKPDYAEGHSSLGVLLKQQKREAEAEAAYRQAISLQPDFAEAHANLGNLLRGQKRPADAEAAYRRAIEARPDFAEVYHYLGNVLYEQRRPAEAETALRKAIELQPDHAAAYNNLGVLLKQQMRVAEAETAFRRALDLRPYYAEAHANLGDLLRDQKRPAEAEAAYRRAVEARPDLAEAYNALGSLLRSERRSVEAEAILRKAIALRPGFAHAYYNLGNLLCEQQRLEEAETALRKAIELQPDHAAAYNNLGVLLKQQMRVAEAEATFRLATKEQPNDAAAYYSLGVLLGEQQRWDEAEAAYRKTVALRPDHAAAYNNLGTLLTNQKRFAEAETALRKAIELQPDHAAAYNNLGALLTNQKRFAEAETAYRKAIEARPDYAEAHRNLGDVLQVQGRFAEALASFKRGHEFGSRNPASRYPFAQRVRETERLIELDAKLPAVLEGTAKPADAAEQIELAQLCRRYRQLHAVAVRFYSDAFAVEPKIAEDLRASHRYYAACSAAQAGCGEGKDVDKLDEKKRERFRKQARVWLQAELAAYSTLLNNNPKEAAGMHQRLQHWQQVPALAGVRDVDALAKLPEDERKQWQQLWDDVEALRKRAAGAK